MKILVLVISGGECPIYNKNKELLQTNTHPLVTTRFIEYSQSVSEITLIDDTLLLPGSESLKLITYKTIDSIEYFLSDKSFTHVIRTNLSSVWHFPRLISYLETREKTRLFTGIIGDTGKNSFVSGAGMYMSRDIAEILIKYKKTAFICPYQDDVAISYTLRDLGVNITPSQNRIDLITPELFNTNKHSIPRNIHHFRLKQEGDRSLEPEFMKELIELIPKMI
jgi:hypothetical protein